ncbi:hypothetical protein GCM10022245_27780 [Streptomyces mayteni]
MARRKGLEGRETGGHRACTGDRPLSGRHTDRTEPVVRGTRYVGSRSISVRRRSRMRESR